MRRKIITVLLAVIWDAGFLSLRTLTINGLPFSGSQDRSR
jgi:hypothetical protein